MAAPFVHPSCQTLGVTTATPMSALVTDIRTWLSAIARWLAQPWRAWGTVGVVLVVAGLSWLLPGTVEDRIRYCGLVLQLLGIATVVALLRDKRRTFKRQSLLEQFQQWLSARPRFRPKGHIISVSGIGSSSAVGTATLSVWRRAVASAPLEERLSAIEANVETLKQDLESTSRRLQMSFDRLATELTEERRTRESTDTAIRDQVEKFAAEGLHVEAAGLLWLILGIVLATVPGELATWIA